MPCSCLNFLCANPCCCPPAEKDQWHSGIFCCCATLDGPGFCIDPCCTLCMMINPSCVFLYTPNETRFEPWPWWLAVLACPCSCCVMLCKHGDIPLNERYHRQMIGVEVESSYCSYFLCPPCHPGLFSAQRFRELRVRGMVVQKKYKPSLSCVFYTCVGGWDAWDAEKRQEGCNTFHTIYTL